MVDNDKTYNKSGVYESNTPLLHFINDNINSYISLDDGYMMFKNKLICDSESSVLAFSPKKKKWYGYSHRAIQGFAIGDKIFDPNWEPSSDWFENNLKYKTVSQIPYRQRGDKIITNLIEAREAALNFARDVS